MLTLAVQTTVVLLYACFVVSFSILMYYQFRMILLIWRFIYDTFGFRPWNAFRNPARYRPEFEAFRVSEGCATFKAKLKRTGLWVLGSFVLFFGLVALLAVTKPDTLNNIWLLN